jgi:hypothetical protein
VAKECTGRLLPDASVDRATLSAVGWTTVTVVDPNDHKAEISDLLGRAY